MKKGIQILFIALILLCSVNSIYSVDSVDGIFNRLEENTAKMQDMVANINQTVFMMGRNIVTIGKTYMKKPDLMKMEITSPQKQTMVINAKEKMMYIKMENGQVMKQKMPNTENFSNISFKFDKKNLKKNFNIRLLEEKGSLATIELLPKDEKNTMELILTIDTSKGVITKTVTKDEKSGLDMTVEFSDFEKINNKYWMAKTIVTTTNTGGNNMKTIVKYSNIKINQGLKDEEFKI